MKNFTAPAELVRYLGNQRENWYAVGIHSEQKKLKDGSYLEEISGQAIVESIKAALKEESETLKSESLPSDQLSLDP